MAIPRLQIVKCGTKCGISEKKKSRERTVYGSLGGSPDWTWTSDTLINSFGVTNINFVPDDV